MLSWLFFLYKPIDEVALFAVASLSKDLNLNFTYLVLMPLTDQLANSQQLVSEFERAEISSVFH
jgi:Ribonuclease G/E